MKKGMTVMTMLVAVSFLVSLISVSPSIAKQATQTSPTSKQPPQGQTSSAKQVPRDKFWELEVDHCFGPDTVKIGQTVTITCYYNVKTPLVNFITGADAQAWGTGKSYGVRLNYPGIRPATISKLETRKLPKFTSKEVQMWKQGGQGNAPKIWSFSMGFTFTPDVKLTPCVVFKVDTYNEIKEPNENNNIGERCFTLTP